MISLVGDGAYLMAPSELATAVAEGLKVTIVISDNHGFQVIRRLQMNVTGHHFGNELRRRVGAIGEGALEGDYLELDLGAVASGLGARALSASTPDELRHALAQAREGTASNRDRGTDRAPHLPPAIRRLVGRRAGGGVRRAFDRGQARRLRGGPGQPEVVRLSPTVRSTRGPRRNTAREGARPSTGCG